MAGNCGGDVEGKTRIDVSLGEAIPVASASFDAGYEDGLQDRAMPGFNRAELVQGYSSFGETVGDRKGR